VRAMSLSLLPSRTKRTHSGGVPFIFRTNGRVGLFACGRREGRKSVQERESVFSRVLGLQMGRPRESSGTSDGGRIRGENGDLQPRKGKPGKREGCTTLDRESPKNLKKKKVFSPTVESKIRGVEEDGWVSLRAWTGDQKSRESRKGAEFITRQEKK